MLVLSAFASTSLQYSVTVVKTFPHLRTGKSTEMGCTIKTQNVQIRNPFPFAFLNFSIRKNHIPSYGKS